MRKLVVPLACILLAAASGTASAQAPGMQSVTKAETVEVTDNYAWQVIIADALNVSLAFAHENSEVFVGGFVLASPVIHLAHGNGRAAALSLTLRTLLPLGGGYAGLMLAASHCSYSEEFLCGLGEVVVGIGVGGATAILIDYAMAKKTRRERRTKSLVQLGSLRANPDLGISKQGSVRLGLRGIW